MCHFTMPILQGYLIKLLPIIPQTASYPCEIIPCDSCSNIIWVTYPVMFLLLSGTMCEIKARTHDYEVQVVSHSVGLPRHFTWPPAL